MYEKNKAKYYSTKQYLELANHDFWQKGKKQYQSPEKRKVKTKQTPGIMLTDAVRIPKSQAILEDIVNP